MISITRADGGVTLLYCQGERTPTEEVQKWMSSAGVQVVAWRETAEPLPTSRTFRNAWVDTGTGIVVDLPKARAIHVERIRRVRNRRLDELDKDWMKAVGQGDAARAATIEAQRQVLRDLPQTFDLATATTPEELHARWPSQLPQP